MSRREIFLTNKKENRYLVRRNQQLLDDEVAIAMLENVSYEDIYEIAEELSSASRQNVLLDMERLTSYLSKLNICILKSKKYPEYKNSLQLVEHSLQACIQQFQLFTQSEQFQAEQSGIKKTIERNQSSGDLLLMDNEYGPIYEREDFSKDRSELRNVREMQFCNLNEDARWFEETPAKHHAESCSVSTEQIDNVIEPIIQEHDVSRIVDINNASDYEFDRESPEHHDGQGEPPYDPIIIELTQRFLNVFANYSYEFAEGNHLFIDMGCHNTICQLFTDGYQFIGILHQHNQENDLLRAYYEQQETIIEFFNNIFHCITEEAVADRVVVSVYEKLISNILFYREYYRIIEYVFDIIPFLLSRGILVESILNPENGLVYEVYVQYTSKKSFKEEIDFRFAELVGLIVGLENFCELVNKPIANLFAKIFQYLESDVIVNIENNVLELDQIAAFNVLLCVYVETYTDKYDTLGIHQSIVEEYIVFSTKELREIKNDDVLITYLRLYLAACEYLEEHIAQMVRPVCYYLQSSNANVCYWSAQLLNSIACMDIELFADSYEKVYSILDEIDFHREEDAVFEQTVVVCSELAGMLLQQYQGLDALQHFINGLQYDFTAKSAVESFLYYWN